MAVYSHQGRARTNRYSPRAKGECDACGIWYPFSDLSRQKQWTGLLLRDTGYLVCRKCLDVPQEQFRTPRLPGDPIPLPTVRPGLDGHSGANNSGLILTEQGTVATDENFAPLKPG